MLAAILLTIVGAAAKVGTPVSLDNGAIRIEIDPQLFSVRYIGTPGGPNFLGVLPDDPKAADPNTMVDGGGVQTDLIPFIHDDYAVRRGPAQVIEQRKDYIALLGPLSGKSGIQLKKEIQLLGSRPIARFRVIAMHLGPGETKVSIRNSARLEAGSTIRLNRNDGDPRVLAGSEAPAPYVVTSRRYWLVPIPSTSPAKGVIIGARVPSLAVTNISGVWTRRLNPSPGKKDIFPQDCSILCLLDDATKTYGVTVQSPTVAVGSGAIAAMEEEWEIIARGK